MTNSTRGTKKARPARKVTPLRLVTTPQSDGTHLTRFLDSTEAPDEPVALRVPDGLDGLTHLQAALAYAKCGWYVLPTSPNDLKNPGSVVGANWHHQSSRDPAQIKKWWSEHPDRGIVLHMLPSRAIAFDLDVDRLADLPVEMQDWLQQGLFQSTRQGESDRGHYVYALAEGEDFGNSAGAFAGFGEVRCRGVIAATPSPHAKAADGGRYAWGSGGVVPPLLDGARSCLRAAPEHEADPLTSAELEEFLTKHVGDERPAALDGVLATFERNVTAGMSRHSALVHALPMAFREAVAGCYPAQEAFGRVRGAFEASFAGSEPSGPGVARRRSRPASGEVRRTAEWAAAQAKLADVGETLERLNRPDARSPDEQLEAAVTRKLLDMEALEIARHRRAAAIYREPPEFGSLADQTANPAPAPNYLVDGVILDAGIMLVVAQDKAGKTTLISIDLVKALVEGNDWLRKFPTHLAPSANVAVWNHEVSPSRFQGWMFAAAIDPAMQKRVYPRHLRGYAMDFENPAHAALAVSWLQERNIKVWVIDPLSKIFLGDANSDSEFNRWWRALEGIMEQAGVEVAIIPHHAGHNENEDWTPRARGTSAMKGNPDVTLTYRHGGKYGDRPPNSKRYLSAYGRDVDLEEITLDRDPTSGILFADESSNGRGADRVSGVGVRLANAVWAELSKPNADGSAVLADGSVDALTAQPWISKSKAEKLAKGDNKEIRSAFPWCVERGYLRIEEKEKNGLPDKVFKGTVQPPTSANGGGAMVLKRSTDADGNRVVQFVDRGGWVAAVGSGSAEQQSNRDGERQTESGSTSGGESDAQ